MEAATHTNHDPVRVLIVDDEPPFVEMVEALLASDGRFAVVGRASNGAEAVDLAKTVAPDVTLMDISMPVVDGIEATRRIREQDPDACILILTGSSIASEIDRSRQAGAAGHVTKDCVGSHLVDAIIDLSHR
jgi:two-component system, NarL family, nitrate/nitrite response regulator NarL